MRGAKVRQELAAQRKEEEEEEQEEEEEAHANTGTRASDPTVFPGFEPAARVLLRLHMSTSPPQPAYADDSGEDLGNLPVHGTFGRTGVSLDTITVDSNSQKGSWRGGPEAGQRKRKERSATLHTTASSAACSRAVKVVKVPRGKKRSVSSQKQAGTDLRHYFKTAGTPEQTRSSCSSFGPTTT